MSDARRDDLTAAMVAFAALQLRADAVVKTIASENRMNTTDLRALYLVQAHPGATAKELGAHLDLSSGSVTALVDRMANAGYIQRVPNPDDRRSVRMLLDERGVEALDRVSAFYVGAFETAMAPDHAAAFARELHTLADELAARLERRSRQDPDR